MNEPQTRSYTENRRHPCRECDGSGCDECDGHGLIEIPPCWFCGGAMDHWSGDGHWLECEDCSARTPAKRTYSDAIEAGQAVIVSIGSRLELPALNDDLLLRVRFELTGYRLIKVPETMTAQLDDGPRERPYKTGRWDIHPDLQLRTVGVTTHPPTADPAGDLAAATGISKDSAAAIVKAAPAAALAITKAMKEG